MTYTEIKYTPSGGTEQTIARFDRKTKVLEVKGLSLDDSAAQESIELGRGGKFVPLFTYNMQQNTNLDNFRVASGNVRVFGSHENSPGHSNAGRLLDEPNAIKAINKATNLNFKKDNNGDLKLGSRFVFEKADNTENRNYNLGENVEREDSTSFVSGEKYGATKYIKVKESLLLIILMILLIIGVIFGVLYFMNNENIISIDFLDN